MSPFGPQTHKLGALQATGTEQTASHSRNIATMSLGKQKKEAVLVYERTGPAGPNRAVIPP